MAAGTRACMLFLICLFLLACGGSSGTTDAGLDAGQDAGLDAGQDAGQDAGGDAGGVLCTTYNECQDVGMGCENPFCDLNLGLCRCRCSEGECGTELCVWGICVACVEDEHCKALDCSGTPETPTARCDLAEEACVCAGECGDGRCDDLEQGAGSCPEDCNTGCVEGQVLSWSCMGGGTVPWCSCIAGLWSCEAEPALLCSGDTLCAQMGGECVEDAEYCYEGQVAQESHGCTDPNSLCCMIEPCVGAGQSYYPYLGMCCPGLRSLPSRQPMGEGMGGVDGVVCFDSCWALICAPCGDGNCQYHMGENFCTCPEDCPHPPYEFSCSGVGDCGLSHCEQQGETCLQHSPSCATNRCVWSEDEHPGQLCNPVTRLCE